MWQKKKKRLKSLIIFHSANEIGNYNVGSGKEQKTNKQKIIKNLQSKSKHENNTGFSLVTAIRVLSPAGNHSPPHLPRMPFKTVLISEPDLGAAQILIRSFFYIFLSPMFTAIRTRMLSFVGHINVFLYIP